VRENERRGRILPAVTEQEAVAGAGELAQRPASPGPLRETSDTWTFLL